MELARRTGASNRVRAIQKNKRKGKGLRDKKARARKKEVPQFDCQNCSPGSFPAESYSLPSGNGAHYLAETENHKFANKLSDIKHLSIRMKY